MSIQRFIWTRTWTEFCLSCPCRLPPPPLKLWRCLLSYLPQFILGNVLKIIIGLNEAAPKNVNRRPLYLPVSFASTSQFKLARHLQYPLPFLMSDVCRMPEVQNTKRKLEQQPNQTATDPGPYSTHQKDNRNSDGGHEEKWRAHYIKQKIAVPKLKR